MEYENMRVPELKALARDSGLRNYSWMRKGKLVALLQNNPPPAPQMSTWELTDDRLRPDRLRQPLRNAEQGTSTSRPTQ